ncbi:hypothetical protein ACQPL0_03745 [Serratia marcescens]|uniref:hypothetical protein n=1 Tax=Serratia marcescens TaxID=615 RepID=UPI003D9B9D04
MSDFFFESLAIQRIELVARLVSNGRCSSDDRELALSWISEIAAELITQCDKTGAEFCMRQGKLCEVEASPTS